MGPLTPHSRIFVAPQPVDCRKGLDGLAAVCRQVLHEQPRSGAVFGFRNRSATALKLRCYAGQGYWLCPTRLSQGRFPWWPRTAGERMPLAARALLVLLWNGRPYQAQMAHDWRQLN